MGSLNVPSVPIHNGYRPHPSGGSPFDLDGKTADGETEGPPDGGEVGQFFHVTVANLDPGEMGLPYDPGITSLMKLLGQEGQGAVPTPGIDSHDLYPPLGKVKGALAVHPGPLNEVLGSSPGRIGSRLDKNDIERPNLVADPLELALHIIRGDPLAVGLVTEIEENAVAKTPVERAVSYTHLTLPTNREV